MQDTNKTVGYKQKNKTKNGAMGTNQSICPNEGQKNVFLPFSNSLFYFQAYLS